MYGSVVYHKNTMFSPQAPKTDDRMSGRQEGGIKRNLHVDAPAPGIRGTKVYATLDIRHCTVRHHCHLLRQAGNNGFVTALLQSLPAAELPLHAGQLRL